MTKYFMKLLFLSTLTGCNKTTDELPVVFNKNKSILPISRSLMEGAIKWQGNEQAAFDIQPFLREYGVNVSQAVFLFVFSAELKEYYGLIISNTDSGINLRAFRSGFVPVDKTFHSTSWTKLWRDLEAQKIFRQHGYYTDGPKAVPERMFLVSAIYGKKFTEFRMRNPLLGRKKNKLFGDTRAKMYYKQQLTLRQDTIARILCELYRKYKPKKQRLIEQ